MWVQQLLSLNLFYIIGLIYLAFVKIAQLVWLEELKCLSSKSWYNSKVWSQAVVAYSFDPSTQADLWERWVLGHPEKTKTKSVVASCWVIKFCWCIVLEAMAGESKSEAIQAGRLHPLNINNSKYCCWSLFFYVVKSNVVVFIVNISIWCF